MDIKITNLAEYIDSIPLVAMWLYGELGYAKSGKTLDDMIGELASRCHVDALPMTLVGLTSNRTVGTVSLVADDLDGSTGYAPWVHLLYVAEEFRRQGVGTELLRAAADRLRELGYKEVYLHTDDECGFYKRLGYEVVGKAERAGKTGSIMKLLLLSEDESEEAP